MRQIFRTLVLFFSGITLIVLSGCTGYEYGPKLGMSDPVPFMANTWKVKEALQDGRDITGWYRGDYWTLEEDGGLTVLDNERAVNFAPFTRPDTLAVLGAGTWDFLDSKNRMEFLYVFQYNDPYNSTLKYREEKYEQWRITRLTETEFWIEANGLAIKLEPF